jgi:hypothetical protein
MKQVDIELNGKKAFNYPWKLLRLLDNIDDKESHLLRYMKMIAKDSENIETTIKSEIKDENGDPILIPVSKTGWGS